MGYSITIGEARLQAPDIDDADEWPHMEVRATGFARDDAPTFPGDGLTANGSSRHPSYTSWAEFCDATGLRALFYGAKREGGRCNEGIMSAHPGCALLTKSHHATIAAALERYRETHPGAEPGFVVEAEGGNPFTGPWRPETEALDPMLARLVWLEWWVRWALANCTVPVIANT